MRKLLYRNIVVSFLLLVCCTAAGAEEVKATYMYTLSDFTGPIPYNWVNFAVDADKRETYIADATDRTVRIFNESGMEVYRFGDDGSFPTIYSVAVTDGGEVFILSRLNDTYTITRCNFRGEPRQKLTIQGKVPTEFATDFIPDFLQFRNGHLYLVDRNNMKVAVVDKNGLFQDGYDLAAIVGYDEKKRRDSGIVGFDVDKDGNILFTVPVNFTAFHMTPDKKFKAFGVRGSSPGKFNVISGIGTDDRGYVYIADTLRCVVMVFDKNYTFKTEFGYRGLDPGNLIAPMELAVNNDRVYVAQSRSRGVSVYRVFVN